MLLDWFFYYAAGLANAMADHAEVMLVTRDHGYELGIEGDAAAAKRAYLDPRVRLEVLSGRQSALSSLREVARISREINRFAPQILHSQYHVDWRLLRLAQLRRDVPHVVTVHDVVHHPQAKLQRNRIQLAVERALLGGPSAYIVHARYLADLARQQSWYRAGKPLYAIPVGPLVRKPLSLELPDSRTVLFFGRVEYYKGLDVLVDAVRLIDDPGLRVIVAGTGEDLERCRRLASDDSRFDWRDRFISDEELSRLFAECSLVVVPYREASQSAVVPLAFAHRRAVVATDTGGLPEAVDVGRTGVLVPIEDPRVLADTLVEVFSDRERLVAMSDAAFAEATTGRLSAPAIARRHLAAYREIIDGAGGGHDVTS